LALFDRAILIAQKAFHILIPLTKEGDDREDGKERVITDGFKTAPVFGYCQTDGELLKGDVEAENWIARLPLIDVQSLGIDRSAPSVGRMPATLAITSMAKALP
jgi:hypothetical protein